MRSILIIFLAFPLYQTFALDVQFEGGNDIEILSKEGFVYVSCSENGNRRSYSYNCYDSTLTSGSYGAVEVIGGSLDADYVKLQRKGSKYIKKIKYYPKKNRSSRRINLWIRTLTQRALLKSGENLIKYRFFKNKKVIFEGEFIANVTNGPSQYCGRGSVNSTYCPSYYQACSSFYRRYCR
jgi:hypothetical protein